uniref:hypothetical protein n=1 Tax=Acinetobacter baumannii TaxID=470 RepID=UPI0013D7DA52
DCWYADVQQDKIEFRRCITADDFVEGVVIRKDALGPGINEGWPVQARFRVEQGRLRILVPNQPPNWLAAETAPSRPAGCASACSR